MSGKILIINADLHYTGTLDQILHFPPNLRRRKFLEALSILFLFFSETVKSKIFLEFHITGEFMQGGGWVGRRENNMQAGREMCGCVTSDSTIV